MTILDRWVKRCKSTFACQKVRAKKKYGVDLDYTWGNLKNLVPEKCRWCSKKLTPSTVNFDHKTPLSRGGKWSLDNLEAICASCNRRKGELTVFEYSMLLRKLIDLTTECYGDNFAMNNILKRLAAGGAWIHG